MDTEAARAVIAVGAGPRTGSVPREDGYGEYDRCQRATVVVDTDKRRHPARGEVVPERLIQLSSACLRHEPRGYRMLETAKHHRDSLDIALISLHYHPTLFPRRRNRRLANKSHAGQWKGEHEISGLDFRIELVVIKRAVLLISRKSHAAHDMGYRMLHADIYKLAEHPGALGYRGPFGLYE